MTNIPKTDSTIIRVKKIPATITGGRDSSIYSFPKLYGQNMDYYISLISLKY